MIQHDPKCNLPHITNQYEQGYRPAVRQALAKNESCCHPTHLGQAIYCQDPALVQRFMDRIELPRLTKDMIARFTVSVDTINDTNVKNKIATILTGVVEDKSGITDLGAYDKEQEPFSSTEDVLSTGLRKLFSGKIHYMTKLVDDVELDYFGDGVSKFSFYEGEQHGSGDKGNKVVIDIIKDLSKVQKGLFLEQLTNNAKDFIKKASKNSNIKSLIDVGKFFTDLLNKVGKGINLSRDEQNRFKLCLSEIFRIDADEKADQVGIILKELLLCLHQDRTQIDNEVVKFILIKQQKINKDLVQKYWDIKSHVENKTEGSISDLNKLIRESIRSFSFDHSTIIKYIEQHYFPDKFNGIQTLYLVIDKDSYSSPSNMWINVAECLLKNGIVTVTELNQTYKHHHVEGSLLHYVIYHKKSCKLINMLIRYGADVNQLDPNGETPLHQVSSKTLGYSSSDKDYTKILLDSDNIEVDKKSIPWGITPLAKLIKDWDGTETDSLFPRIEMLIEFGASLDMKDQGISSIKEQIYMMAVFPAVYHRLLAASRRK
nr:hypothetical protein [Endozoicomonas sp.]